MEPIINRIWPRVFRHLHRTSVPSRRGYTGCAEQATVPASTNSTHIRPPLLVSRLYQPSNLRDVGQETRLQGERTCKSQRLMLQAGLIHPSNPGCYYYLPATVRSMEKLVRLVFVNSSSNFTYWSVVIRIQLFICEMFLFFLTFVYVWIWLFLFYCKTSDFYNETRAVHFRGLKQLFWKLMELCGYQGDIRWPISLKAKNKKSFTC